MTPEILVVGGGPAGAAAARLLAQWGHAVRIVTRPRPPASPLLPESLPPSCRKLFDVLALTDRIERAPFVHATGNTVWWGRGETRVEPFAPGEHGWQVTSDGLADLLLDAAVEAGVRVAPGRLGADEVTTDSAPFVLDCSGRGGVVARARGWREYEPAQKTVALVGVWRADTWPVPDATHTLVESYADGWLWSVPLSPDRRGVAAMIDPRTSARTGAASRAIYLAEIAKAPRFSVLLACASFEGGPWGFDASMYSSAHYVDGRVLLVGDAASFIDPLSSAGVKKALASAWLAAVAVHTALQTPSMRTAALKFFAAREREMYDTVHALTRRFFAEAAAGHPHPFWTDRVGNVEAADALEIARDNRVKLAFERIRAAPNLALSRGAGLRVELQPAVSGREIVLEPRIVSEGGAGVRHLFDVDLVTLVELAPSHADAGDLFHAYVRRSGPVALPDFLRALAVAVAHGWLVWRD